MLVEVLLVAVVVHRVEQVAVLGWQPASDHSEVGLALLEAVALAAPHVGLAKVARDMLADEIVACGLPDVEVLRRLRARLQHLLLIHCVVVAPRALERLSTLVPLLGLCHSCLELLARASGLEHALFHDAKFVKVLRE